MPTQRRAVPILARIAKWIHEGCSTPGDALVVIQKPIPMAKKRPREEPRKKTIEFIRARVLWAAMTKARTNTSGLSRTTIPIEKAVASVWLVEGATILSRVTG